MSVLSNKKIVRLISKTGPDTFYRNKPLIAWLIERPTALRVVLEEGANPNIDYEIEPGLSVTACCSCKIILKKIRGFKKSIGPFEDVLCMSDLDKKAESVLTSLCIMSRLWWSFHDVSRLYSARHQMTFLLYISLVYESNMPEAKNIFFGFVGLCMVTAAAFQFLIVFDINDKCDDVSPVSLSLPPTIAGACLTFSFFANAAWLLARRSNGNSSGARVALLVWSAAVSAGMVAAGATLGQIPLYPTVCPTLGSTRLTFKLCNVFRLLCWCFQRLRHTA